MAAKKILFGGNGYFPTNANSTRDPLIFSSFSALIIMGHFSLWNNGIFQYKDGPIVE